MSFTFDLQRFDTATIAAGENQTFDGVTYTALDDEAVLNLDDSGKVSGLTSGKVSAVVADADDSPSVSFDATEKTLAFTLTAEDGALVATNTYGRERTITLTEGTLSVEGYNIVAGTAKFYLKSSSGRNYTFESENSATYSIADGVFTATSDNLKITISEGTSSSTALEFSGKVTRVLTENSYTLNKDTTVSFATEHGTWTVTSTDDDSGSISLSTTGIEITSENEGALSIKASNNESNYVNFTSITGTINFTGEGITLNDGSSLSGEWVVGGETDTFTYAAKGGTVTILFDGQTGTFNVSEGASLTINFNNQQVILHSGSFTDSRANSIWTLTEGSVVEVDGVTYTAVDSNATLNIDDDGKVSGLASGKVSAVVSGAETSPIVTFDATDAEFNFTATSDGSVISITPFPIEFISGEFTYNGSRIDITAGSDLALVTQRGDFVLRNQNHFVTDSAYIFTSTSLTSDSEHVISKFSLTNGDDVRELNLEQLGKVINHFDQQGVTLVEGSSEVLNIGNYKLTATATDGDAGLNFELGEDGMTFVPNTGDGTLTVALSRNDTEIISGILECTSGTVTIGYDHAVTFTEGTSFNFTWNNYVSTITATGDATTAIALTDNGITFTPGSGDGGLNLLLTKDGKTVFGGTLNISDGSITFNSDEKKFSFTEGTKISLGIGTDGSRAMDFEVTGGDASFKMAADENGNFTITPD
ncbi:MAG: hypothetical protein IJP68_04220, partial [Selenomonadaceae bacterium]|nr:hypothetical protein [Selenomonadaceae bacterium]